MKRQRAPRFGRLVFFLPLIVLLILVMYAILTSTSATSGTLDVQARVNINGNAVPFDATATVNGKTGRTPFNLTLSPGSYTVTFGQVAYLHTPAPVQVTVVGGVTAYGIGTYTPIAVTTDVSQSGFNTTTVTGLHGITPFTWVNTGSTTVKLEFPSFAVTLSPGQSFMHVFSAAGTVQVNVQGTADFESVDVT